MEPLAYRVLLLGFILGLEHSLDPDHLIAISTLQPPERSPAKAGLLGGLWGLGHSATILIVGLLVISFNLTIPIRAVAPLEALVGIMLIALGIQVVRKYFRKKVHVHEHRHRGDDLVHVHFHTHATERGHGHHHSPIRLGSVIVGMVHGLAGSALLTLLAMSSLESNTFRLLYLLMFGIGSTLGMVLVSMTIGLVFGAASGRSPRLQGLLRIGVGVSSIVIGIILIRQGILL